MSSIAKQFSEQGLSSLKSYVVWLGGLFTPEAYITATRQFVAQTNSWSLEELVLEISIFDSVKDVKFDECCFGLVGLKFQGAVSQKNKISLSVNVTNDIPVSVIRWSKADSLKIDASAKKINLPVYLNSTRAELLFKLAMDTDLNESQFNTRGVAILASNLT